MKTKLEMAHEWMMKHDDGSMSVEVVVFKAWQYADAMQAEAEKRKPSGLPESLRERHDFTEAIAKGVENYEKEEWQPDWSQAPSWANWWSVDENGTANFSGKKPNIEGRQWVYYSAASENLCHIEAPSFGYTGDWRNSLRKRPQ